MSKLACPIAALLSLCIPASGDIVEFDNGDTLTGSIQAFEQGQVVFQPAMATKPLQIEAESVSRIVFPITNGQDENPPHAESLTLANNDVLPCQVVSMDATQLHISTRYGGDFSIPRSKIRALQFGIVSETTIFTGKERPSKWTHQSGKWSLAKANTYQGSGVLAQQLTLPANVCFKFDLSWQGSPNFAFRFCAENDSATTKQDTYELIFNSAGMQIRRYENKLQPSALLANIPTINPYKLKNDSINIELRANRSENLLSLYIDSKLIGTWLDPLALSKGNHMIFNNRSKEAKNCIISNISVTTLNDGALPRHREKISSVKADLLIDSEGEKISGLLKSISGSQSNKRTITIDLKHASEPLKIPDRRVSTLLFAEPDHLNKFPETTFEAFLVGGGHLHLDKLRLVDGRLSTIHPILGPCSLSLELVSHINRSGLQSNKKLPVSP